MPGGRPTKMIEETVQKLEEAFLMGCPDIEACLYADISRQTLHNYQLANPEFVDRKERLKQNPFMKSRKVLLKALDENDTYTAHKILDRKDGKKVVLEGGENPITVDATWVVSPVRNHGQPGS